MKPSRGVYRSERPDPEYRDVYRSEYTEPDHTIDEQPGPMYDIDTTIQEIKAYQAFTRDPASNMGNQKRLLVSGKHTWDQLSKDDKAIIRGSGFPVKPVQRLGQHMPYIRGVHESEVDDLTKVPKIGNKYPDLRPQPLHPDDQELDHPVEDKSPNSLTTGEDSPPTGDDDNVEPPNPSENTETHANAQRGLFGNPGRTGTLCRRRKETQASYNCKDCEDLNKRPTRTQEPAAPPKDGQAAGASANAVTPARPA